jgi:uncharacterized protein YfaS (alpha-2-macroglobulin family)
MSGYNGGTMWSCVRHDTFQSHFRVMLALILLANAVLGCRASRTPAPTPRHTTERGLTLVRSADLVAAAGGEKGMDLTLGEGSETPPEPTAVPIAQTAALSPEEIDSVLDRLPPLDGEPSDRVGFRLPEETLPAPRPGDTIDQPFPPPEAVEPGSQPTTGPLSVLRYSPEGHVDLAPYLSVTFGQPMVPITADKDLAAQDVPVRLSPLPEGSWRWVGTKTLMYEPTTRFPMATEYVAEIPAGTTSATGGELAEAVTWTFRTPPPQLQSAYPTRGPSVRRPVIFASFDQHIDPSAVLETIHVKAGGQTYAISLATAEDVEADETVRQMAKDAGAGRWLAFRPNEELPYDTTVTVDIGPGTPSLEGPLNTEGVQSFTFTTYGPLRVVEAQCGWGDECRPAMPWRVRFSNPLDEEAFDESLVQIEPALSGGKLSIFGDRLLIEGRSQGRTTYSISLKAQISDSFGQQLGRDEIVTIKVGSAEPVLYMPGERLVVLDPASKPSYSIFTINISTVQAKAFSVQPDDWPQFLEYLNTASRRQDAGSPPGQLILDKKVPIESVADTLVETPIDLTELIQSTGGHLILVIEPEQALLDSLLKRQWTSVIRVWVQSTHIGLDAFADSQRLVAWASSLDDGSPLEGVELAVYPGEASGTTHSGGLATLTLPSGKSSSSGMAALAPSSAEDKPAYLVARLGDDVAILPEGINWWGRSWQASAPQDECRWYVIDDRQMYRPGEEVHIKGWVRIVELQQGADTFEVPGSNALVSYQLSDARGNDLLSGTLELNSLGGFDTSFGLPEAMNLGQASLQLTLLNQAADGTSHAHSFQVQEFRRPEFEVSTSTSEGPHFADGHAVATVEAKYYAGGPLGNADVTWNVTSRRGTYRPPRWDEFVFGIWEPWWRSFYAWGTSGTEVERGETFEAVTDASGIHRLRIDFETPDPALPTSVTAEAVVMDVNRQAWSSAANMLVHAASLYVGLRTERLFVQRGEPIQVDAIVTDLDGHPVGDRPIEMRAVRLEWTYTKGEWVEQELDEQLYTIGSTSEPVSCTFQTTEGGRYNISATVTDTQGRRNFSQVTVWVSGGQRPTVNRVEQEVASLIPDGQEYQPGDTAEILVQSPFAPAEGLLTLRRGGIIHTERFHMDGATYTVHVPIKELHIPNLHVQVDLVGSAPRLDSEGVAQDSLPARPAFATGSLNLAVPPYSRTLALDVKPEETAMEPGGVTTVHVTVEDATGHPVEGAELAVIVVDEAILALTGYELLDPVSTFYQQRSAGVSDYHLRQYIMLTDPDKLLEEAALNQTPVPAAAPMAPEPTGMYREMALTMGAGEPGAPEPIRVRTDFEPLAVFEPSVPTDSDGHAAVRVEVPDSLTRYRVMVIAVYGTREFGKGESAITARLPLMVRPSAPRFLNFGDQFELPVLVQNQTNQAMQVDVAVRATNATALGATGQRLTVPANDRREVRFPFTTESAGTARFQVGAASGRWADAAQFSLPVYTPATTEAFAMYGTLDEGAVAQPVLVPSDAYVQFGGLDVSTSSTALQALSDAVLYLTEYPFECSEQIASRVLAVAALRDVLSAFQAQGLPSPDALVQAVQRDIEILEGLQNGDGGFPVWQRGRDSWPFHSIHALHALARAKQKGFTVPDNMLVSATEYVRNIETKYPDWYSDDVKNTLTAYALYVRSQLGDVDTARAHRLVQDVGVDGLKFEALGWLLSVLSDDQQSTSQVEEIRRFLNNRVTETAGAATFTTSYREQDGYLLLASNRRADGIILEALIRNQPDSDLIPKIVRGLLAHRERGRWSNTQENVFILLALDEYFQTYEAQTPEFVARVWLGDQYVAGFDFVGRTTDYQMVTVPLSYLAEQDGIQNLVLSKEGPGRLYYRLGMRYAPTSLELEPMDQGFTVLRTYEAVDDPEDVRQDKDGTWHIRAGARVRVRLTMVAPSRRYHVALVDPMPAGLESLNPALAVTGSIPQDPQEQARQGRYWWWHWTWYEHQNLRDERVEAFASLLWDGIHTYTYVARATTPGRFVVPPPKAEEMYSPEVFGRGSTDVVVVE